MKQQPLPGVGFALMSAMTMVPLSIILFSHLWHYFSPEHFANPALNSISYLGAFVVVLGAMLSTIGRKLFNYKR